MIIISNAEALYLNVEEDDLIFKKCIIYFASKIREMIYNVSAIDVINHNLWYMPTVEYYLAIKKKTINTSNNTDESQKYYKWKKTT